MRTFLALFLGLAGIACMAYSIYLFGKPAAYLIAGFVLVHFADEVSRG